MIAAWNRVRGLPVHHRLVHFASVETGAESRRMVEEPGARLFVFGSGPLKAAMLGLNVTIDGSVHHVDQLRHASAPCTSEIRFALWYESNR